MVVLPVVSGYPNAAMPAVVPGPVAGHPYAYKRAAYYMRHRAHMAIGAAIIIPAVKTAGLRVCCKT